jgi:hypothetical protein
MTDEYSIVLTGNAAGVGTATVSFAVKKIHENGIDILTTVQMLEYRLEVETFFFGYNISCFFEGVDSIPTSARNVVRLLNYNETLKFTFIETHDVVLLSLFYKNIYPQTAKGYLQMEDTNLDIQVVGDSGTRFAFKFMVLQNKLSELAEWFHFILEKNRVSISRPYP